MIDLEAETLFYKTGDVEAQALIYTLAETVTRGNSLANVKTDAMVDTLAATLSKKVIQILCNEKRLRIQRHFGQLLRDVNA